MLRTILAVVIVLVTWKTMKFAVNVFAIIFVVIGMLMQEIYRKDGDPK